METYYTAFLVPTWKLNAIYMLGLACLGVVMGGWLKRKLPLLRRLNIPTPIAGGMVYAILALVLRDRVVNIDADAVLRDLLMVAFMTTIGLSARLQLIRQGGLGVVVLLVIATAGAVVQNLLGMGLAALLRIDPRLGILTGSVALAGGPATALAFGPIFEKMGVTGATAAAFAAATFGIVVAGLIGGYIGGQIIRRHRLKPLPDAAADRLAQHTWAGVPSLNTVLVLGISMGVGGLLSDAIERRGVILPSYIGSMFVAAVIRNLDDRFGFARIAQSEITALGQIALYLFIVMALLTLRLWELVHLALPLVAILAAQVALCWLMSVSIAFRLTGHDYDAAVTSAGFCGFMLGVTSNAIASMEELVEQFGPAPRAFLVVPIVGAFLIDLTNSAVITVMANWWR
jgi:glutamate:Na+ symporter, ESS family